MAIHSSISSHSKMLDCILSPIKSKSMAKLFLTVAASLLLLPDNAWGRSWTEIDPLHGRSQPDLSTIDLMIERDPLTPPAPTASPSTGSPSMKPTESPSRKPTRPPTDSPSASPTLAQVPPNDVPLNPDRSYFNYDNTPGELHGPGYIGFTQVNKKMVLGYKENAWASVDSPADSYWNEFDVNGFGAWDGVLENRRPNRNMCGRVGLQSPIDVRENDLGKCDESHEVRSLRGDYGLAGSRVQKLIQSNKLRLVFERRPCRDLSNVDCQEPDPPSADFPNGWGGFADAMHVDFKVPAEHLLNGRRYDAEMQIYHLHAGRRRMPTQAVLISATDDGYNYYFDEVLKAFEYVYENNRAQCARKIRRERRLVSDVHDILGGEFTSEFDDYTTWADYSTEMDRPDYDEHASEMERRLQVVIWDPHHNMLIPTIHFYRYEGSLTEPPCGEFVSWFIADIPMVISKAQLVKLKRILFTNVDPDCEKTSVHFDESVARPIQDTAGRPVGRCTRLDFVHDQYN